MTNPEMKISCRKCGNKFTTKIIRTHKTYTNNDKANTIMWSDIFERPQYRKCQLCRNIGKAFDFINKEMSK